MPRLCAVGGGGSAVLATCMNWEGWEDTGRCGEHGDDLGQFASRFEPTHIDRVARQHDAGYMDTGTTRTNANFHLPCTVLELTASQQCTFPRCRCGKDNPVTAIYAYTQTEASYRQGPATHELAADGFNMPENLERRPPDVGPNPGLFLAKEYGTRPTRFGDHFWTLCSLLF